MITLKHIEIYKSFQGDGDGFVRCASNEEKAVMTYKHWSLIDDFVHDLNLVNKGLTSKEYSESLNKRLKENCDNQEIINQLKQLVDKK
jgi:hypothetical protein